MSALHLPRLPLGRYHPAATLALARLRPAAAALAAVCSAPNAARGARSAVGEEVALPAGSGRPLSLSRVGLHLARGPQARREVRAQLLDGGPSPSKQVGGQGDIDQSEHQAGLHARKSDLTGK